MTPHEGSAHHCRGKQVAASGADAQLGSRAMTPRHALVLPPPPLLTGAPPG